MFRYPADVQKIAQSAMDEQEQTTQEFIEEFSCANQQIRTESMNGTHRKISIWRQDMHPLELPAISVSIVSKNPTTANPTAGSLLLFRPDLVVAQLPHEHFFVYRLPGVIEHRRDTSRTANFRALPGNDNQ